MSSKINLQTCEYARKSSIFQDNQLIYDKADKALYEAKKRGKNNCVIYSKELENEPFMSQITAAESE